MSDVVILVLDTNQVQQCKRIKTSEDIIMVKLQHCDGTWMLIIFPDGLTALRYAWHHGLSGVSPRLLDLTTFCDLVKKLPADTEVSYVEAINSDGSVNSIRISELFNSSGYSYEYSINTNLVHVFSRKYIQHG